MSATTIVRPDSVVNSTESEHLSQQLQQAIEAGSAIVVVDCSNVEYINSSGMGAIMQTYMDLSERGGDLRLVAPNEFVRKTFEAVGILSFLETYDSVDEAAGSEIKNS